MQYVESAKFEHQFWLHVLADHSQFIHDSLYPSQTEDIATASSFMKQFDQLLSQVPSLNESNAIALANAAEEAANNMRTFKLSIIERHITGEMKIHLTPTFVNHMVNEVEEYLRILDYLKKGEVPPIFHELHHHLVWLIDARGHAGTINDLLDGVEVPLKQKSHAFTKHFEAFYLKAVELTGYLRTNVQHFPSLTKFTNDVEIEMGLFKTFLNELEEMGLSAEVLGTFTPTMADHMAREEQYYLMKLAESSR